MTAVLRRLKNGRASLLSSLRYGHSLLFDPRKFELLIAIAAISPLLILSTSRWPDELRRSIQTVGLFLIVVCIAGRTWCALWIAGRKVRELVDTGPYSISRNPLYLFSIVGAVGAGAQLGSLSAAILGGAVVARILFKRVLVEERRMLSWHGEVYESYMAKVPRFWPRLSSWHGGDFHVMKTRAVIMTFLDGCFFLASIPIAGLLHYLHQHSDIPTLLLLP
jgi:protein-S-isoprenylcysteine O-methyltransferase Ste14